MSKDSFLPPFTVLRDPDVALWEVTAGEGSNPTRTT